MKFWSCREVSRLVAAGALDDGPAYQRWLARLHLAGCRHCRLFLRQIHLIGRAARAWSSSLAQPAAVASLEQRLIKNLAG